MSTLNRFDLENGGSDYPPMGRPVRITYGQNGTRKTVEGTIIRVTKTRTGTVLGFLDNGKSIPWSLTKGIINWEVI